MNIAVINFSGNVGKTTVCRHLLMPRLPGAEIINVESINADAAQEGAIKGSQFGQLQDYLQSRRNVVVDVGASNVETLLKLMVKFHGSHEEFDYFVVPTVPAMKQQEDTIGTLVALSKVGIPAQKIRVVFNQLDDGCEAIEVERSFGPVLGFLRQNPSIATVDVRCAIETNEIFERAKLTPAKSISDWAHDETNFKAMIAQAADQAEKLSWANQLGTRRLAQGILPKLDACFEALALS